MIIENRLSAQGTVGWESLIPGADLKTAFNAKAQGRGGANLKKTFCGPLIHDCSAFGSRRMKFLEQELAEVAERQEKQCFPLLTLFSPVRIRSFLFVIWPGEVLFALLRFCVLALKCCRSTPLSLNTPYFDPSRLVNVKWPKMGTCNTLILNMMKGGQTWSRLVKPNFFRLDCRCPELKPARIPREK